MAAAGIGIIAAVLGIFVFIARETYPLFGAAEFREAGVTGFTVTAPLAVGVDPYTEVAFAVGRDGLELRRLDSGELLSQVVPPAMGDAEVTAAYHRDGHLALGLGDGRALFGTVDFDVEFVDGSRVISPRISFE